MTRKKIEIIGLGGGDLSQLPLGIYRKLKKTTVPIVARTLEHPVIKELQLENIHFIGLDHIYEQHDGFQEVYEHIVLDLLTRAEHSSILYVVPGHPMVAEQTVQLLLQNKSLDVHVIGGRSYLDDLFTALRIDPVDGFQFIDATSFSRTEISYRQHTIFTQVYDAFIASEVKLTLLEDLPETYQVAIVEAAGTQMERLQWVPIVELDRVLKQSNLISVYVPPPGASMLQHQFSYLREIVATLRGPNGCPWDKKQTHASLRKYALEETYELIDAIDALDDEAMVEELGDVLLQVMLHSQIGEDDGYFSMDDVIRSIAKKMIHRHPHVFDPKNKQKDWETLKKEEKPDRATGYLLDGVITHAPALQVADQLQNKAAKVGFDWENIDDIWAKFHEEKTEFLQAVQAKDKVEMEKEFGDILFVLANIARHYGIQGELALHLTNKKFMARFTEMEKQMRKLGKTFSQTDLGDLNHLWESAKGREQ